MIETLHFKEIVAVLLVCACCGKKYRCDGPSKTAVFAHCKTLCWCFLRGDVYCSKACNREQKRKAAAVDAGV